MSALLNLALIGTGHLGGSFALALKEAGAEVVIAGYDADPAQSTVLHQRGGLDRIAPTIADAVADADVVMLATPLRTYRSLAQEIAPHLQPHAVVTDLGSVKRSMESLAAILPAARLVPGHPIAGGERTGAAVASAQLFQQLLCILTPGEEASAAAIETVETLWHVTGADVLRMPTQVHDSIYAHVSHLPHYIAFVAAEALFHQGVQVAPDDETLQRFLRISRSNPRMWTDIALENREALLPALATYIAVLEHFAKELDSGEQKTDHEMDAQTIARRFVPRILASCLISGVSLYEQQSGMNLRPFGAGGMRDIVAPAAIDPEGELEAISHAASSVATVLHGLIPLFRLLENHIGAEDETALLATLTSMANHAHTLVSPRQ